MIQYSLTFIHSFFMRWLEMLEISTVVVASPYTSFMSHNVVEHLVELDYYFRVHSFIGERFSESSHVQVHAGALCRKPLTTSVHSRQLK